MVIFIVSDCGTLCLAGSRFSVLGSRMSTPVLQRDKCTLKESQAAFGGLNQNYGLTSAQPTGIEKFWCGRESDREGERWVRLQGAFVQCAR